jgi:hypothetical protein
VPGATRGQDPVGQQEQSTGPSRDDDQPRRRGEDETEPGDARGAQGRVGEGADDHDGEYVLAADPLTQDEHVLRTDRDDEGEAESEAGEDGEHDSSLGRSTHEEKRRFLPNH